MIKNASVELKKEKWSAVDSALQGEKRGEQNTQVKLSR